MSIESKIHAFLKTPAGARRVRESIDEKSKSGARETVGGIGLVNERTMREMGQRLKELIIEEAWNSQRPVMGEMKPHLPDSVMRHLRDITVSIHMSGKGSGEVELRVGGNTSRPSVSEDYNGVDNIVALFNNGYYTPKHTYGWWDNHAALGESAYRSGHTGSAWIETRNYLPPAEFMQRAVARFNDEYGTKYNVVIELAPAYTEGFNVYYS